MLHGLGRNRWWLAGIGQSIEWMQPLSLVGIHRLLKRLKVHYKRGRRHVHSPDLLYGEKLLDIQLALSLAHSYPDRFVFLYQDEFTYYRRATVDRAYALAGSDDPCADQGLGSNTKRRIAGSLNAVDGCLFFWQRASFPRSTLIRYYRAIEEAYLKPDIIFLAQDNWPTHSHPDIYHALQDSRIVLLFLPTYAPWTNPIEKVWRRLYQEILHHHPYRDDWEALKLAVDTWLSHWLLPSSDLLSYVGLCTD